MNKEIKDIKKIITHLHLDGSLDINIATKWLKEEGENLSLDEVTNKLTVQDDCASLATYLEKFTLPCHLLQTKNHLTTATYTLFKKLHSENVIYAEVRFAPLKHTLGGLSLNEVVTSVINGMNKAKEEIHIRGNIILCCMRNDSKEDNLKIVNLAKNYLNKGVSAIDLAGDEKRYKTKDFQYIFTAAKKLNIPFTIHAGEADNYESINSALDFGTKRLGHGINAINDEATIKRLKQENILLEICYTSNYQTKAITTTHPIESLYKKGINISINTDNDTVSNTNITKEYQKIITNTNLTINDIIKCNYNSIPYLFTTDQEKKELQEIYQKNGF